MSNGGAGAADSVGGAVHQDSGAPARADDAQSEPVLEQNNASIEEKLDGIAAQTRVDLGDEPQERYEAVLRQRITDAGIPLADSEVSDLARRAAPGSGGGV